MATTLLICESPDGVRRVAVVTPEDMGRCDACGCPKYPALYVATDGSSSLARDLGIHADGCGYAPDGITYEVLAVAPAPVETP